MNAADRSARRDSHDGRAYLVRPALRRYQPPELPDWVIGVTAYIVLPTVAWTVTIIAGRALWAYFLAHPFMWGQ